MSTESRKNLTLGKWSRTDVPHKGWVCVGVSDLGRGNSTTCEMCEKVSIRYVHHMQHAEHPDILDAGCVCAGHMEGNYAAAKGRERAMQKEAAARLRQEASEREEARRAEAQAALAHQRKARLQKLSDALHKAGLPGEQAEAALAFRENPRWHPSIRTPGNECLVLGDIVVTVYPDKRGGWSSVAWHTQANTKLFGRRDESKAGAKLLAYFAYRECPALATADLLEF